MIELQKNIPPTGGGKRLVALTGMMGGGKSTLAAELAKNSDVTWLPMDDIAKTAIYTEENRAMLRDFFGEDVLFDDGTPNKEKIARRIFSDADLGEKYKRLVSPIISAALKVALEKAVTSIVIVENAMHFEQGSGDKNIFDIVITVYCDAETQLQRLVAGRGFTDRQVAERIALQMPIEQKLQLSDITIKTDSLGFTIQVCAQELLHILKN